VIMFHWCCLVHLYCDHVSLVLSCPSVFWSCFSGVVLSTCIVIMFLWCTWSQYRWTRHQWNMITIQVDKTTPVKHDHNTGGQNNTREIMFHWCCFCSSVLWSCFTGVIFVHLYCDLVSLVLFCPSVLWSCFTGTKITPVKHDHNTDEQKQHQWNMITIQMDKTTPENHDHNTDVQNNTRETWSQYRWNHVSLVLFLSICIVIMFH
jgi:hypothetical protein